ncbi:hypothetical protein EV424DRAFT_1350843 [Suillus variegatus]|nr:hypothetical protein EV424DRAFT_1350843 [Suillus variegatus]
MVSFKKLFQKCKEDKKPSLKHSQSMPFRYSQASMFEPYADPFIAVYHGKTPSKPSNIVHVEQAPGMRDIHRAQWHPGVHDHPPSHAHFDTRAHLLDQFPNPPPPPPKPTRSASGTTSSNPQSIRPQLPPKHCNTSDQPVAGRHRTIQQSSSATYYSQPTAVAYPSLGRKKRREATADQAMADLLQTPDGRPPVFGSSRQAERARAKSSTGHSYIPVPHDLLETADGRPPVFGSSRQAERVRTKSSAARSHTPVPYDLLETPDGRPPVFGSSRQADRVRTKSSAVRSYTPVPYDLLETADGRPPVFGSSRQAERLRVKSSVDRSQKPLPPLPPIPPIPTSRSPRPFISRSVHSSRTNLNHYRDRR